MKLLRLTSYHRYERAAKGRSSQCVLQEPSERARERERVSVHHKPPPLLLKPYSLPFRPLPTSRSICYSNSLYFPIGFSNFSFFSVFSDLIRSRNLLSTGDFSRRTCFSVPIEVNCAIFSCIIFYSSFRSVCFHDRSLFRFFFF